MKALQDAIAIIERQHGKNSIMDMTKPPEPLKAIPTGSLPLDIALGIGGIPVGRIVEVYGPESSGKTTLCYHMIAAVQRSGGIAAFIDTEHAVDPIYAQRLGVDMSSLVFSQPDHGEQALDIVEKLVASGAVQLIVVDSVAALVPKAELEGQIGDSFVGLQARMMSQALRKFASQAQKNETTIVFTNQIREKIGVMFGSPETQPGGRALKFFASVRIDIRRIESVKEGTVAIGNRVRTKIVKNKVAPPFRQAEFMVSFGSGVDQLDALIDLGVEHGFVTKSGSFFSYGEERLGQGKQKSKDYLTANPQIADEIETKVREKAFGAPPDYTQIEGADVEATSTTDVNGSELAELEPALIS